MADPDSLDRAERFADIDDAMRGLNLFVSVAAAVIAGSFGVATNAPLAAVVGTVPLVVWLLQRSPLRRPGNERAWTTAWLVAGGLTMWTFLLLTGGSDSFAVYAVGLYALMVHVYYPRASVTALVVGVPIVGLVLIDLAMGASIDVPTVLAATTLSVYLPVFTDQMVALEQRQRRRATVDQLTGCLNRHALETRAHELEAQAERTRHAIAVVVFDLDHFKQLNDTMGHAFGDRVLERVSAVVRGELRRFELFYRLGGEEFAVILAGADVATAMRVAERLRAAIERTEIEGRHVTASFGVASSGWPLSVSDLLELADHHLYEAKRAGRNRLAVAPHVRGTASAVGRAARA